MKIMDMDLKDNHESVLNDKEILPMLYKEASEKEKFAVSNAWENVKFYTTITSALMTISILAFIQSADKLKAYSFPNIVIFIMMLVPIIVIIVSFIAIKNLEREYSRFLEWISVLEKVREVLGLYQEVQTKKFSDDKYLLPKRFVESQFPSSEEFIKTGLAKRDTLIFNFKMLHYTYIGLSFLILFAIPFL